MDWRKYNSYFNKFWRNSRYRFSIQSPHRWRSLHTGDNNQSCRSSRNNRYRQNHRTNFHYYIALCLLSISLPVLAEDPKVSNTSNPQAAATGNVTNQAVQFQNNGAPSRQQLGPSIVCNGSTMTFTPFYMGNHVKPWEHEDGNMSPSGYTMNENWGVQLNFMVPLDGSITEQCKRIGKRQEQKMRLDYELVRIKECANLQVLGFTLHPGSHLEHICSDVVPIVALPKKEPLSHASSESSSQAE